MMIENIFSNSRKNMLQTKGFTIVELLIVIVVIAILAAITIVAFTGVQNSALESSIKSDLHNAATALEMDSVNHGGYPVTTESINGGQGLKSSNGTVLGYTKTDDGFCLSAHNSRVNTDYYISSATGQIQEGGCAGVTTALDSGGLHNCAASAGKMYCWGWNLSGQLGDGTTTNRNVPVAVNMGGALAGKTITDIDLSSGASTTCALASGQNYCWGAIGSMIGTSGGAPSAIATGGALAGKTIDKLSVLGSNACAVSGGKAYCWGTNNYGQLGDGTTTDRSTPVAVSTSGVLAGKTVTDIVTSGSTACALASGQVYCWGFNYSGQLGNGTTTNSNVPVAVNTSGALAGKTIESMSLGSGVGCVVANDKKAYCWGMNNYSSLGDGTTTDSSVPVAVNTSGVLAGKAVSSVAVSTYHVCAIAEWKAYCWGSNGGRLGDGTTTNRSTPVAVNTSGVLADKAITKISPGQSHTCVIASGKVYCWGQNNYGELGDGTGAVTRLLPGPIAAYPQ